jgi:capsular exopolysaccharide synthesis family protein
MYCIPNRTIPLKTIIITSANKSEGKSTVSSNLAIALAEAGRKVLLVDFDFRRPRVHTILGLQQEPGSMDILFNNAKVEDVIQQTLIPNVRALTSGKRPPNPAEITRSAKLREMIRSLKDEYDHIIIDSPPFGIISDAAPLIQESDGVVLAVRFNQTKSPELDLTIDNLKKSTPTSLVPSSRPSTRNSPPATIILLTTTNMPTKAMTSTMSERKLQAQAQKVIGLILLTFVVLLVRHKYEAQQTTMSFQTQNFRLGEAHYRVAEPTQLADTVLVWGDITLPGTYLVPRGINLGPNACLCPWSNKSSNPRNGFGLESGLR